MDCDKCKQTTENCECHIPDEEKHKEFKKFCKELLDNQKDLPKDKSDFIEDNFWDLVDN